jgi:hypothetical protein
MTFDLVREPLGRVLSCAWRISDDALRTLTTAHTHPEEVLRLCRDLSHFNRQLLASFPGTDIQKVDIEHELNCVYEDAAAVAQVAVDEHAKIDKTFGPAFAQGGPEGDTVQQFHQMRDRAWNHIERLQSVVTQSCARARTKVIGICSDIDNVSMKSSSLSPLPNPIEWASVPASLAKSETTATSAPESDPPLSQRQYEILEAMLNLRATDPARRKTTEVIAAAAEAGANPEAFKIPIKDLKKRGFIGTKPSRGGGCWLTATGRELAERLKKR